MSGALRSEPRSRALARRLAVLAVALGALVAGGCESFPLGRMGRARKLAPEVEESLARARALALAERFEDALSELRRAVARDELAIQVQRELQELQVRALRKDEALREADQRLAREPDRAEWLYLRGRLEEEPELQAEWFERALRADPDLGWARYGLGIAALRAGEVARGERLLEEALRTEPDNAEFLLGVALAAHQAGRVEEARERTLRAAARFPADARFARALVSIELQTADRDAAFRQALRALQAEPLDPAIYDLFLDWLHADDRRIDLAALDLALVRVGVSLRERGAPRAIAIRYHRLVAHVAAARGRHEAALLGWRRAASSGAPRFADFEDRRRSLIQAGLYDEAYETWARGVPRGLLEHPAQRFPARWPALAEASRAARSAPSARALLALALAYRDVGWLEEALLLVARAELLDPACASEALAIASRIESFQTALQELDELVAAGHRGGPRSTLQEVVALLQRRAREVLGAEPSPTRIEELGFFASRVDPTQKGQGLGRLLETFGHFAVLGQVLGGPVDAYVMREIHRRELEGELLGRPLVGNVVVGEARAISALAEMEGAGIAGAAVHHGYFVNLDVVREWAAEVEELRRIHGGAERRTRLLDAPPRPCAASERRSLAEPLHVAQKLALRAALREDDPDLLQRLFELVSLHERAHLADAAEFLPVFRKPFAVLGFLLAAGFSSAEFEARLELRAELSALAAAEEADLVLSHIVSYALGGRSGAHARGFRTLLERFLAHLEAHLREYPTLDPGSYLLQQLHRLSNEEIRRVARELARDEGLLVE